MNNIPINEAETIFEPYWDSGESYPCKRKYSVYENYTTTVHPDAIAKSQKTWCNIRMEVEKGVGLEDPSCTISRDCSLLLDGYDLMQCNASFPKNSRLVMKAVIDGEERTVLDCNGFDENREIKGEISGHEMTWFSFSFYCEREGEVDLFWLGLANKTKQQELEQKKSGFSAEWEGCFEETPKSLNPRVGLFATAEQLEELREKIKHPFFKQHYEKMKQKAEEALDKYVPEEMIGDYISTEDIRWCRDRDRRTEAPTTTIHTLTMVGAIERNEAMLRLAARGALSFACSTHWCEGIMGVFPGATWHHRSFLEDSILHTCAMVLDFAGHLLTWHGRNIIHNAMILKGLSRMDADFHMMEYIHHMNQGIVFCRGRIAALTVLAYDYPRFRNRVDEAETVLEEALERYIFPDGGCKEGTGYWKYTITETLKTYYILSRYRKQNYEDYLPDSIVRAEQFILATLSLTENGRSSLAINDTHPKNGLNPLVAGVYSRVGKHQAQWRAFYEASELGTGSEHLFYFLVLCSPPKGIGDEWIKPSFWNLTEIGHVGLYRETESGKMIHFHVMAGPKIFSHCHSDSGSFLLEAGNESFMMDLGTASYSSPFTGQLQKAVSHNLFMPLNPDGFSYDQKKMSSAKTVHSEQQDGVFTYTADLLSAWEKGLYNKNYRRIFSPQPHVYLIMDEVEYTTPHASSFLFITDKPAEEKRGSVILTGKEFTVTVTPLNWKAEVDIQYYGGNQGDEIHRVWMNSTVAPSHKVVTAVIVSPKGEEAVCNVQAKATENGFEVVTEKGTYEAWGDSWKLK